MDKENILASEFVSKLACRLNEREALDVADGTAEFGDDDVGCGIFGRLEPHPSFDFVGDVRNDLNRIPEVLPTSIPLDHARVNLARGDIRGLRKADVQKALVVADVEVGLGTVVGHKDLAVLERIHRSRVDVKVGVELLHHDAQTTTGQKIPERRSGETFTE